MNSERKTGTIKAYLLLHLLLMIYSLGGICSKLAGKSEMFSPRFFLLYGLVLMNLAVYAVMWQQILKRIPLITAYANKAVTVVWGLIWGMLVFGEVITVKKLIGAAIIIAGIIVVVSSDE